MVVMSSKERDSSVHSRFLLHVFCSTFSTPRFPLSRCLLLLHVFKHAYPGTYHVHAFEPARILFGLKKCRGVNRLAGELVKRVLSDQDVYFDTSAIMAVGDEAGPAAMVRPAWPYRFWRRNKWCRLDSNLRLRCRVASPS